MNELRNRGVVVVLIAVVEGLKGFPEAIAAVCPEAMVQTCIVHLIRNAGVRWRKPVEWTAAVSQFAIPSAV